MWNDNKEKSEGNQQPSWNVEVFVQVVHDMVKFYSPFYARLILILSLNVFLFHLFCCLYLTLK